LRAHEYIQMVTADISDPVRAADVRRELQAHVDQTVAELLGKPIDEEAAELIAVGRMGHPDALTRQFAEAHHQHLPWRHYLSVIPIACLIAMFFIWDTSSDYWRVGWRWLAVLVICLIPDSTRIGRLSALIRTDVAAKRNWLARQPLRRSALVGGVAGVTAGACWAAIPILWDAMWERWGELLRAYSVTPYPNTVLQVGLPLIAATVAALTLSSFYSGSWPLSAAFSGLTFPLGFLPIYALWGRHVTDWVTMSLFLQIVYFISVLLVAWLGEAFRRQGQPSSAR
jgi:hypothetical protein